MVSRTERLRSQLSAIPRYPPHTHTHTYTDTFLEVFKKPKTPKKAGEKKVGIS